MIMIMIALMAIFLFLSVLGFDKILIKELVLKRDLKRKTSNAKATKENFFYHTTQDAYEISVIREYCIKNGMKLEVTPIGLYYCCKLNWEYLK